MLYNRWWFNKDRYAFTLGGGKINNPGRYLVLASHQRGHSDDGHALLHGEPRRSVQGVDISEPTITCRASTSHSAGNSIIRHANVPYWSGPGGVTPPGGNNGIRESSFQLSAGPSQDRRSRHHVDSCEVLVSTRKDALMRDLCSVPHSCFSLALGYVRFCDRIR